jgi:hypothetical protein
VIIETNPEAQRDIDVVVRDPYGEGWLYRLRPTAWQEESAKLMTVAQYREWLQCNCETRLTAPDPQKFELPDIDPQNISY